MIKKLLAIILLVMIASLSVAGCTVGLPNTSSPTPTPTSTPTPPADYSSYYDKLWQGAGAVVTQPFTKAVNLRGNDIYTGIVKNATIPNAPAMTYVMEHTKSEAESKQVYDDYVAAKINEGFSLRPDAVAEWRAEPNVHYEGIWIGQNGPQWFYVMYQYSPNVHSWEMTTEAGSY